MSQHTPFPWHVGLPGGPAGAVWTLVSGDGRVVGMIANEALARWIAVATGAPADKLKAMGERVALLRRRRGWTQKELAEQVAVSRNTISLLECGRNLNPGMKLIRDIAILMDVSMDYVVLGRGSEIPNGTMQT